MSKIDKNVQPAREWLKKHAEAPEAAALQKTLAAWEAKVKPRRMPPFSPGRK